MVGVVGVGYVRVVYVVRVVAEVHSTGRVGVGLVGRV